MTDGSGRKTRVTSSHWGAFEVDVEADRIVATRPFAADPHPSAISAIIPAAVHHRSRVCAPSIRRGWLETRARGGRGSRGVRRAPLGRGARHRRGRDRSGAQGARQRGDLRRLLRLGLGRPLPPRAEPAAPLPERDRRLCRLLRQLFDRLRPGDHAARDRGELPRAALRASGRLADDPRQHRDAGDVRGHQPEELPGQHGRDHRARDRRHGSAASPRWACAASTSARSATTPRRAANGCRCARPRTPR